MFSQLPLLLISFPLLQLIHRPLPKCPASAVHGRVHYNCAESPPDSQPLRYRISSKEVHPVRGHVRAKSPFSRRQGGGGEGGGRGWNMLELDLQISGDEEHVEGGMGGGGRCEEGGK